MGFEYIPWISDMLDLSGGFGSRQLSMNQGLAHLQASAYMNSCWNVGGGFMPYNSFGNGMEFLLDPSFAMWQTSNGISSSSNMFGGVNFGNLGNFGNFGNFTLPWQQTPPSNNGGGSGNTYDANKDKCADYTNLLKGYIKYLNNDHDHREWIAAANNIINKSITKDYTYENKYNDLLELAKGIDKDNLNDYIKEDMANFTLNGKSLKTRLFEAGFEGVKDDTVVKLADDYKKNLDKFKEDDTNLDTQDNNVTKDNIIPLLSYYNSNKGTALIQELNSKYGNPDKDEAKENVIKAMNKLATKLKEKAEDCKNKYNEATQAKIETYINGLTELSKDANAGTRENFIKAFDNLYMTLRYAEAATIENDFNKLYGDIGAVAFFKSDNANSVSVKTKSDLDGENLKGTENGEGVGPAAHRANTLPEGSTSGSEGSGSASSTVTKTQSDMEKDFCDNEDYKDCFEKTGKAVDGKTVYKWTDEPMAGNPEITAGTLFVIDNGEARKLTMPEKRLYGVQISEYTDNSLSNGTKIYIWKGENCTKDGVTVKSGDLCVIIDNVPRPLTKDENTEYGLMTKQETDGNVDNNAVYKWTHTKECNGVKKGDLFVIKNNKPEKLTNNDLNKFIISVSEKKGEFDYTDADSQTKKIPVYKNTGEACTVNGETIGTGEFFTVENGKVRTFTSDEAARIPDDMLV